MCARLASYQLRPHRRFTRPWVLDQLRTAAWVAVITILIWVYADIYHTRERSVRATLEIHAGSADNVVLLSPAAVPLRLEVKGRRHAVDKFAGIRLSYDAARELGPGRHAKQSVVDILRDLPAVRKAGVEIVTIQPEAIDIHLDTLVRIVGVRVKLDSAGGEPADVTIRPERVDLLIPAARAGEVNTEGLTISTETVDLRDKPAGEPIRMQVRLRRPDVAGCRLEPEAVRVNFTVGQQVRQKEFTVTVRVQSPTSWLTDSTWSQYKLLVKDPLEWTKKLTVKGNRMDLDKLRAEDIEAYIILAEDDKRPMTSWLTRKVFVRLPEEIKATVGPVADVSFRLARQTGPAPP